MPINLDRHLELLAAAEDAMQALAALVELVQREAQLALEGETPSDPWVWKRAFDNITLMGQVDFLLRKPLETRLVLRSERDYYSPTRIGINRRSRKAQERRRAAARTNEDQNNDAE